MYNYILLSIQQEKDNVYKILREGLILKETWLLKVMIILEKNKKFMEVKLWEFYSNLWNKWVGRRKFKAGKIWDCKEVNQ